MDLAMDAVTRYGRRLREEWKEGHNEVWPEKPAPPQEPPGRKTRGAREPAPWWEVLRVPHTASKAEIRRAYRKLIKENHPDKAAHLSAAMQANLEREAKRLNDAYERAVKAE
jgi:DnaJ-domain-containing protein 1